MTEETRETVPARLSPAVIAVIILSLIFSVSLLLRVFFPYDQVFSGELIKFTGVDVYYHMRLVDNIIPNFPGFSTFYPYLAYPDGVSIGNFPFFNWLLAGIIQVIGLGAPSEHTIDTVGVYFPAVMGALTVIPVYVIGSKVFSRRAGIIAAALIAVLPGEFLGRSILGFTDYHVMEVLFTTTAAMFLVMATRVSRERDLSPGHLRQPDRKVIRPLLYSFLSGVFLGMYLLVWIGGLFFAFVLAAFFVIQFFSDHLRRRSTDYLAITGVTVFLTAMVVFSLAWHEAFYYRFNLIPLGAAVLAMPLLHLISRWMGGRRMKPVYYPLSLLGAGLIGGVILYHASGFTEMMLGLFRIFAWDASRTIIEMQPFLRPGNDWTLDIALGNFGAGFLISLVALVLLAIHVVRHGEADRTLLLVWGLAILLATLGQRRFAYYLAVNVSLLTGYAFWTQFRSAAAGEPAHRWFKVVLPGIMIVFVFLLQRLAPWLVAVSVMLLLSYIIWQVWPAIIPRGRVRTARYANGIMVILFFFLVFFPSFQTAAATAEAARFAPSDAWVNSLRWMRENTPEPFGEAGFYYQDYRSPAPEEDYPYPDSAYGVTAWTDYGYWIARIAHRPPTVLPGPGGADVARFFLSQDEEAVAEMAREMDSKYVIIDDQTVSDKLWALAQWAGGNVTDFHDVYLAPQPEGDYVAVRLFYPQYFQTTLVRLYHFDGQEVVPEKSLVITFEERQTDKGETVKLITDVQQFSDYEDASGYIAEQETGNYRIVSLNPFETPVQLPEMKNFRLVHGSEEQVKGAGIPSVKIFEYSE